MAKAGEYNGQERQEASEFSRVTSIPRGGAWTQTWGLLARRLEGSWSWAKSWWSGGWEQGTLQGTRSGTLSPTHCSGQAPRLKVSSELFLSLSWVGGCHPGQGGKWGTMRPIAP